VLASLTEDDLKSLNVTKLGDRKRLLKEIAKITGQKTTSSDSGAVKASGGGGGGDLAMSGSDSEQRSDSSANGSCAWSCIVLNCCRFSFPIRDGSVAARATADVEKS
jgi:hypothetical protein